MTIHLFQDKGTALERSQYNLYLNLLTLAQRELAAHRVDKVQELSASALGGLTGLTGLLG